jgi:Ser/Thr protein kinase RdoA (MazF antagonist)
MLDGATVESTFLMGWLVERYNLEGPIICQLLRSYTNDVYLVQAANRRYVLKVYGKGWRTEAAIRDELALLEHLDVRGVRVATPAAPANIQTITMSGQEHYAVLFDYAPGIKPQPPFTNDLYYVFGQAIALMHAAADSFVSSPARHVLDLGHVVHAPVAMVLPLLKEPDDRKFLLRLSQTLQERIDTFAAMILDWGPIHGDATLDNLHVTEDGGIVLYDFDTGGPGWRAADLQGWTVQSADYTQFGEAYRQGYSQIRPLASINWEAAPYLIVAWDIWEFQFDLERRILEQGPEQTTIYLQSQMAHLRKRAELMINFDG